MIGDRIKELRCELGLSQTQLASKIGVSKQCISNWENENIIPSVEMIIALCRYFNVSPDFILEFSDRIRIDVSDLNEDERSLVLQIVHQFSKERKRNAED